MTWKKFEYFLNAVFYCIWRADIRVSAWMDKSFEILFYPIIILLPRTWRRKFHERCKATEKEIESLRYDKKNGWNIGWAKQWFDCVYFCYPSFFIFMLLSIIVKLTYGQSQEYTVCLGILTILIPIAIAYIPVYKAVYSNDKYIKYYKQFEKEDEYWHKKWYRITTAFCIGGLLSMVWGILLGFGLAFLFFKP